MTQDHGDAGDLVGELRTKWSSYIERPKILQEQPNLMKDFAALLSAAEDHQAEIGRLITSLEAAGKVMASNMVEAEAAERVIEAARALEHKIDQIYDVDGGRHGSPFDEEWKALRGDLTAYDKTTTTSLTPIIDKAIAGLEDRK